MVLSLISGYTNEYSFAEAVRGLSFLFLFVIVQHLEQKFEESLLRSPNLIDFTTPKKTPFSPAWLTFTPIEPWQVFRLPPASPYDNFLKAAGC